MRLSTPSLIWFSEINGIEKIQKNIKMKKALTKDSPVFAFRGIVVFLDLQSLRILEIFHKYTSESFSGV